MKRYILDSGPAFDCMFRRFGVSERMVQMRRAGAKIGIGMPILGEIIAGIEASETRERNWPVFRRSLNMFRLWPFDRRAAFEYGRIQANLKRRGRIIQQVDIQLAAIALTIGDCTVVSSDTDLS